MLFNEILKYMFFDYGNVYFNARLSLLKKYEIFEIAL